MPKRYVALVCRSAGNTGQNSPKTESSSASSTSSLSYSPGLSRESSGPSNLSLAYGLFEENEIKIFQLEISDFYEDLKQVEAHISDHGSSDVMIVSTPEDIRQCLFPHAASLRHEQDMIPKHTLLPEVFHRYLDIEVLSPTGLPLPYYETPLHERVQTIMSIIQQSQGILEEYVDTIQDGYTPAVCVDTFVDSGLVVRARGLPWQITDQDVALFFCGLNIAPGGIALCLNQEGRRNGEALVRFENPAHREFALRRHRKFLYNRYIEVYRGTGEEFLKVAVGADLDAVRFASQKCAMIIRMRGLPFDCTEQQIREFFTDESFESGIIDQGILFVNRIDGRPSGDAFVLFADEPSGRRALAKHKQKIGSRYVELFRTSIAEVQQVFNRTIRSPQLSINGMSTQKKDCVRLRGLPYEAQVQQVVDFMGEHSKNIIFQGVHMIYNNQGHPSGEAFIQMTSESTAAAAATAMHNKYMELGRKKRYVEVFQVSIDEVNLLLNAPIVQQASPPAQVAPNLMPGLLPAPILPLATNPEAMNSLYRMMPNGSIPMFPVQQAQAQMLNLPTTQGLGPFGLPNTIAQTMMPIDAYAAAQMHMYPETMHLIAAQQHIDPTQSHHQPSRFYPADVQHLVEIPPPPPNMPLIHT